MYKREKKAYKAYQCGHPPSPTGCGRVSLNYLIEFCKYVIAI